MQKQKNTPRARKPAPADILDPVIPISWFTCHSYLRPGQSLSYYLIHELELSFVDAATVLGKDECTVRRSFRIAEEKTQAHLEALARRKRKSKEPSEVK